MSVNESPMRLQQDSAIEMASPAKFALTSVFASDAFDSTSSSLDLTALSAQSSMLSTSSGTGEQHRQLQRQPGPLTGRGLGSPPQLLGAEGPGLLASPLSRNPGTFQAMDDAVTAVFGKPMAQLPEDYEVGPDSNDPIIQRSFSTGSKWPRRLQALSHDLDLSAVAAESRALYASEDRAEHYLSQASSDGWHPMGNAVNRDLGSFNHAQQMAPPSVLPPLDRLLTPSPPMLRRWSSQPLEDSLTSIIDSMPVELARQHQLEMAQQREHQQQQRQLLQQNQEREQRQLLEQHHQREQLQSQSGLASSQPHTMQGMPSANATQDALALVQFMQNMQLLNQENSIFEGLEGNHFENLEGSRFDNLEGTRFDSGEGSRFDNLEGTRFDSGEGSRFDNLEGTRFDSGESSGFDNPSWATGSAGALGRPPPPPPSTLPMMMGVQAAGAGGHSNLVNYGVLSGGMVRSPFSGMDLQYAPPLGPSLRPGALGGHAPRDIMRLMSEPASIYNSVGGGGGGGGGACSQFKPPVHMGSPPRPLSRAYSGPTTPMAQPTARASSRRSSCPPCNKGQPSPLTMLTLNLLTPSTGTGFFCPAIPASSTLNGRSLRPQRQRSRDSRPTSTGPRIPPPPVEVSGSRRRRSSNQVTDEMLTETVEGGHISAVPMNSQSQDDILRCSSQSS